MPLTEVSNLNTDNRTPQTQNSLQLENLTKRTTINFLEDLYSYPPKFTVKWDAMDELKEDLFLDKNYGVLEHSIPFIDFVEDWFFNDFSVEEVTTENYSRSSYIEGFLNKIKTSNFYNKETKDIQSALSTIPVYVIMNGHREIVLNKPATLAGENSVSSYLNKTLYNYCGAFDPNVSIRHKLGFFFLNNNDAEIYLQEIAKADIEGTQTLGLTINCIGLDCAYKITREHHPGVDFRFVPNLPEVKNLLQKDIGTSDTIVDDEQQQLRFRRRPVNMFPYWGKLGNLISPSSSFLQRNEYFKGVPIFIVQVSETPKNLALESYYTTIGIMDTAYSRCIQFLDYTIGYGHNWIMQGSLKDKKDSESLTNYVFFNKHEAKKFVQKQGNRVARYKGSRTSNLGFMIRKPKIYIYNLEDFIEYWENTINENFDGRSNTIFDAKATYFVPQKTNATFRVPEGNQTVLRQIKQNINVKYRIFKQFIGIFLSVT